MWGAIGASLLGGVAVAGIHHVLTKPKAFHVEVEQPDMKVGGINIVPVIRKVMSILPESTRKNFVSKMGAPYKALRDRYDFTGESPYTVTELKSGKLWQVSYDMESNFLTDEKVYKQFTKLTGMDVMDEKFESRMLAGAEIHGELFKEVALRDIKTFENWVTKKMKSPTKEDLKQLPPFRLNMIVVKLDSGSLLLYAPVTIRPEVDFGEWLDGLGKVEWVVVPSAAHTLNINATVERYPEAKIIGPGAAEAKVKLVTNLPRENFDFHSTNADELKIVNELLAVEGCEIYNVDGDTVQAVLVRCNNMLFENDLVYGHHDGEGVIAMNAQEFRQCKPEDWFTRIWKFCLINKPNSPNGCLPGYRFWMMDPNGLGAMSYEPPASDGSSCIIMANSLREILNLEFESVVGVHGGKLNREDFRKTIDSSWNWLDGKSLIE